MIHSVIRRRIRDLEARESELRGQLALLPEGRFSSTKNLKTTKWYIHTDSGRSYLPKANRELASQLSQRKYLELALNETIAELEILRKYTRKIPEAPPSVKLLQNECYQELLIPCMEQPDSSRQKWMEAEYPSNPSHPENLIHKTPLGYSVRSKSELLIAISLQKYGIAHRYECPLVCNSRTIYPDFTILHPLKQTTVYWEHLGMMDNPSYAQSAGRKIQTYISEGIYPGLRLILTSETADNPLELEQIERVIRENFL